MCYKKSDVYDAKVVPLKDLLLKGGKYKIPEYQRPYAWEDKHWVDLLNDLQRVYGKGNEYLFGSVYLGKTSECGQIEILDGQQRFTTLYIFLNCLGFNKSEICDIELGGNDKEFFERIKDNKDIDEPQTASQKRLKECYEFFKNNDKIETFKKDNKFRNFIQNKVFFIKTIVDDKNNNTNSIITFITQTDRGKRLSNLEKIKSNLYYAAYILGLEKSSDIKKIFGECYKYINMLYDKPEKGERMIVETLFGLLLKVRSRDKDKQDDIWKLDWMSGEDKITYEINKILSSNIDTMKKKMASFLDEVLHNLTKIRDFLGKYSQTVKGNELFHNELDLNRYTLVAMIEGDFTNKENEPEPKKNPKSEDEERFKKQKLDLEQYKNLKRKELDKMEFTLTLPIIQQSNSIELLNQKLIERAEFSIFKAGNGPYSEFLFNPLSKIQSYKYEYFYLIKKGIKLSNYRYFLFVFEQFYNPKFDYKSSILDKKDGKGEYIKIEREHLFAQNPTDEYWSKIKQGFENNKTGYDEWRNQIGNILLLPKTINIEISNAMPWEKAHHILEDKKYTLKDIIFQSTFDFLKDIYNECNKKQNDIEKIQKIKKLCEERTEMLKYFVWHRF